MAHCSHSYQQEVAQSRFLTLRLVIVGNEVPQPVG